MSFVLAGVARIRNPAWWDVAVPSTLYRQMITSVRQGTFADLNLITTSLQNDLLGCVAAFMVLLVVCRLNRTTLGCVLWRWADTLAAR